MAGPAGQSSNFAPQRRAQQPQDVPVVPQQLQQPPGVAPRQYRHLGSHGVVAGRRTDTTEPLFDQPTRLGQFSEHRDDIKSAAFLWIARKWKVVSQGEVGNFVDKALITFGWDTIHLVMALRLLERYYQAEGVHSDYHLWQQDLLVALKIADASHPYVEDQELKGCKQFCLLADGLFTTPNGRGQLSDHGLSFAMDRMLRKLGWNAHISETKEKPEFSLFTEKLLSHSAQEQAQKVVQQRGTTRGSPSPTRNLANSRSSPLPTQPNLRAASPEIGAAAAAARQPQEETEVEVRSMRPPVATGTGSKPTALRATLGTPSEHRKQAPGTANNVASKLNQAPVADSRGRTQNSLPAHGAQDKSSSAAGTGPSFTSRTGPPAPAASGRPGQLPSRLNLPFAKGGAPAQGTSPPEVGASVRARTAPTAGSAPRAPAEHTSAQRTLSVAAPRMLANPAVLGRPCVPSASNRPFNSRGAVRHA